MSGATEELGIRIRSDGVVEATNGLALVGGKTEELGKKAAAAAPAVERLGKTQKELAAANRLLPAQITDIVTSLASGQPAWLVAIQQGGQLKDAYGGVVPAARAMLGMLTPLNVALGGSAVVVGGLAAAWLAGRGEANVYTQALELSGNAAGTNKAAMADMAREVAAAGGTQHEAAAAIAALAATGRVAAGDLSKLATAAVQLEDAAGRPVADTARAFAALARDPLQATLKLNEGVNFLTASLYDQLRALTEQGKLTEAARLAQNAYADAMTQRSGAIVDQLGSIERGWKAVRDQTKGIIDDLMGLGRPLTQLQKLAEINKQLSDPANQYGAGQRVTASLQQQRDAINRDLLREADADSEAKRAASAAEAYANARQENKKWTDAALTNAQLLKKELDAYQRNNDAIVAGGGTLDPAQVAREKLAIVERTMSASFAAQLALTRAGAEEQLAVVQLGYTQREEAAKTAFQRDEISARAYQAQMLAIDTGRIDAQIANIKRLEAAEQQRGPLTDEQEIQRKATLVGLETKLVALREQRLRRTSEEDRGEHDVAPLARSDGARDALQRFKATDEANAAGAFDDRRFGAREAGNELVETIKRQNIELIKDDRARGIAEIANEQEVLERRLDIAGQSADEQKRLAGLVADWRLQREKQLTEQLKPEWQKQLDLWSNTTLLMRDSFNSAMTDTLHAAEDAWVRWAQTGKLSIKSVGQALEAEAARFAYRSLVGQASGFNWGSVLSGLIGTVGSVASGSYDENYSHEGRGYHSGGIAGGTPTFSRSLPASTWTGAPRYHGGGIAGDEVPAVLRQGEGVFTPEQMKALAPVDSGRGGGRTVHYSPTINIDSRTDRAEIYATMQQALKASQVELLEMMERREV